MDVIPIRSVRQCPERINQAAQWFSQKWNIPMDAYLESMERSLQPDAAVPAWYFCLDPAGEIIAGLGVIENDFHKRPDLTPNLCALYVAQTWRKQGLARRLLDYACGELARQGIDTAYLITGHTQLYERYGFTFYGMIEEDDGNLIRMYCRSTTTPKAE